MIDRFFYSIWTLIFLLIWLFLYSSRKDLRTEIMYISLLFGFGGIVCEFVYTQDWWQPITLMSTRVGIEDFLIGFAIGGVATALYEEIYHKRFSKKCVAKCRLAPHHFLLSFALLFLLLFYVLKLASVYATIFAYLICIFYMLRKRNDLISNAITSGLFMLIFGIGIYWLLFFLDPDYFQKYWFLRDNWYSQLYMGIPIAEYIWYFLTGAFIGPLYVFIKGIRLAKVRA